MWDMKKYNHIDLNEREQIFLYLGQGKKYREIGRILGRDHRAIREEVKRNSKKNSRSKVVEYSPSLAQNLAAKRRKESKFGKLDNPVLKNYVIRKLGSHWSPEQISGRLKRKAPNLYVSAIAIYDFIYDKENNRLRLWEFLRHRHPKRQLFNGSRVKAKNSIPNRVFIDKRPQEANLRKEVGHWETDNIEGIKTNTDTISIAVDRKSIFTKMDKLLSQTSEEKSESIIGQFERLPGNVAKTFTMDNGMENTKHEKIARFLGCETYFCNAYHFWEKGTVENTIGLVREYIPKGTDLSKITKAEVSAIAWELNNRPRKKLGFKTPLEVFFKEAGWGA